MLNQTVLGDGHRSVVLLHGFLGTSRNLRMVARQWLQRDRNLRFLLLDLPGHGHSSPLPESARLEDVAAPIAKALQEQGFEDALVVGHSLGARVGLALRRIGAPPTRLAMLDMTPGPVKATETDRVLKTLLAAPQQAPDRNAMMATLQSLSPALRDWLAMNLERSAEGVRWRIDRRALAKFHEGHVLEDLWPEAEQDPERTHALLGRRSGYVRLEEAERLTATGIEVAWADEAGHFVHVDALERVVSWLETLWS
ncbi:MAG: alpha/beta fold hydrolase [Myxococcota bacterium]